MAVTDRRTLHTPWRARVNGGVRVYAWCMHVTTRGASDGQALLLLHGGIGTGTYHWGRQANALEDLFCVHLPDLPGHGQSQLDDPSSYALEILVAAVDDYIEQLGPPVHLGGFSMGGHTALELVTRRPDVVRSLVLVGVSIREHEGLRGWRELFHPDQLAADYPFWAKQLSKLHAPLGGDDAWRDVCLRDSKGLRIDVDTDALAAVDAPVLLIRGDRDTTVEVEQYADLRAAFPNSEEAVIPAGGHDVQLTRANVVKPVLRDFYERVLKEVS
jgi:pimeloyl-ACP methyl ester carboxylesterase